jgi:hypothetical protein
MEFRSVIKHLATLIVDETFRRRALGEDHGVRIELQMKVGHFGNRLFLDDRLTIHQSRACTLALYIRVDVRRVNDLEEFDDSWSQCAFTCAITAAIFGSGGLPVK